MLFEEETKILINLDSFCLYFMTLEIRKIFFYNY